MRQIADITSQLADVHRDLSRVSVRWDPLGFDRNGSCYWWHAQDGRLFVEQRVTRGGGEGGGGGKGGGGRGGGRGANRGEAKAASGASPGAGAHAVVISSASTAELGAKDSVEAATAAITAPVAVAAAVESGRGREALQLVQAEEGESAVWGYYEAVEEVRIEQVHPTSIRSLPGYSRLNRC